VQERRVQAAEAFGLGIALFLLTSIGTVNALTPQVTAPNIAFGFVGQTLTGPVTASNLPSFGTYNVAVAVDPTLLTPTGIDLTGTMLSGSIILLECINGILVIGSTCDPVIDRPGVAHVVVSSLTSSASGSGLLFTVDYTTVKDPGCGSPVELTAYTFVYRGFTQTGITGVNGQYVGSCTKVPEFPLGLAGVFVLMVPALLAFRKRASLRDLPP